MPSDMAFRHMILGTICNGDRAFKHMDEATPHIHERHVFDATNRYGEIEPKQETALEELGFELPDPEKKRSKTNNRKVAFDSACRTMFLDICKRHGLELDEEPSYGGRKYLEKQDYIRMKQKEEIADQQETILMQIDKVNENRLELPVMLALVKVANSTRGWFKK